MKRIFTRQEAIDFLECSSNIKPCRIIENLGKKGFKNIEKVGRGEKLTFVCDFPDDTDEQCYYIFKDILINEYGYGNNLDYNKVLEFIELHIDNKNYISQSDMAEILELSPKTIGKYRKRLENKILKSINDCKKVVMGHETDTGIDKDISELYYDVVLRVFKTELNKLYQKYEKSLLSRVAFFKNKRTKSFIVLDERCDSFSDVKESMVTSGNNYIASYPLYILGDNFQLVRNNYLAQMMFQLVLRDVGFDYVFFLYLYEITEELKQDKEYLDLIKRAIQFKNQQ